VRPGNYFVRIGHEHTLPGKVKINSQLVSNKENISHDISQLIADLCPNLFRCSALRVSVAAHLHEAFCERPKLMLQIKKCSLRRPGRRSSPLVSMKSAYDIVRQLGGCFTLRAHRGHMRLGVLKTAESFRHG